MTQTNSKAVSDREIVVTRVLDAPRELVWQAWTEPEHVVRWWGPRGFTTTLQEMNVSPGGVWRFIMHGPDGVDYQNKVVFIEVVPPERLVYRHGSDGADDSGEFETTVSFERESASRTKLTLRMLFDSAAERDRVVEEYGAVEGANQTLDCLAEYLAEMPDEAATS